MWAGHRPPTHPVVVMKWEASAGPRGEDQRLSAEEGQAEAEAEAEVQIPAWAGLVAA